MIMDPQTTSPRTSTSTSPSDIATISAAVDSDISSSTPKIVNPHVNYYNHTSAETTLGSLLLPPSPALTADHNPQLSPLDTSFPRTQHKRVSNYHSRNSSTSSLLDKSRFPPLYTNASTASSRAASPTRSPTRPSEAWTFLATSPATKASIQSSHRHSNSLFENIFAPFSAPGPEEYPAPEDFDMESGYTRSRREGNRPRQSSVTSFASTVSDRLGWFKNRALPVATPSSKPSSPILSSSPTSDPLLTMDIHDALFPMGPADPLDPTSFHDLLTHATAMIETMQNAYRQQSAALRELQAEHAAQADELEESQTRGRLLKTQLEDMGERLATQERQCEERLVLEREQRVEAEKQPERTVSKRQKQEYDQASDSGFESDNDASRESLSSLSDSPTIPSTQFTSTWGPRNTAPFGSGAYNSVNMFKGSDLRTENQALRLRVAELEAAVDSCLDLIR